MCIEVPLGSTTTLVVGLPGRATLVGSWVPGVVGAEPTADELPELIIHKAI